METQELTQAKLDTLWQKALQYASFRAFLRILRVAAAAGLSAFLATLIPQLQSEPSIGGVPLIALLLIFLDKYLRDNKVY